MSRALTKAEKIQKIDATIIKLRRCIEIRKKNRSNLKKRLEDEAKVRHLIQGSKRLARS